MKFLHVADCHIGGWPDPKMKLLGLESFRKAMDYAIEQQVDFVLIAGDLFNTALPQIDLIRETVGILKKVKDKNKPVYIIPGSHDFSPSGKTMLEVLEKAGLCKNVFINKDDTLEFTNHAPNVKITGMLGRKGGLEKNDYAVLNKTPLEQESGFKIFMFHTALEEFKPESMASMEAESATSLPNNFDYYAGGHVHYILKKPYGNGFLTFPGALFPNNFKELEEFKCGSAFLYDNGEVRNIKFPIKDVLTLNFDAENKNPMDVYNEIAQQLSSLDPTDKIVTMRVKGVLASGKPSDIDFKDLFSRLGSAYFVAKNISKLKAKKFQEVKVEQGSVEEVEQRLIQEHTSQVEVKDLTPEKEKVLTNALIDVLNKEKEEGEKAADFEKRIFSDASKVLEFDWI